MISINITTNDDFNSFIINLMQTLITVKYDKHPVRKNRKSKQISTIPVQKKYLPEICKIS
jgi:hypothetical protein